MKTTPHVLLVDDDRDLAAMLHEYLELQGFAVELSGDGEEALKQVAANPPDLVILDVMLPGMDGFAVLQHLRAAGDNIPVIMLTARGEESDRIIGLMHGADDYLPKPFNPLELSARIQAVLKRTGTKSEPATNLLSAGKLLLDPWPPRTDYRCRPRGADCRRNARTRAVVA